MMHEPLFCYPHQDIVLISPKTFLYVSEVEGVAAIRWKHEVLELVDGAFTVMVLDQAVDHRRLGSSRRQLIMGTPFLNLLLREQGEVVH